VLLQHRCFPVRWRNWISLFLTSSVSLNGARDPWIRHRRGVFSRATPLSPYLFILAIHTLQHILRRAIEEELLSPLRDRTSRLGLSLYVDDAVVLINLVKSEVDMIMDIMQCFGDATGLRISDNVALPPSDAQKSSLMKCCKVRWGPGLFPHHISWSSYHSWPTGACPFASYDQSCN
jgi:hypothetical protein